MLAQKRSTTPKVLIFDGKNSSQEELIQDQFFEKSTFLVFFEFNVSRKVILRRTQRKNYHLKVLPTNSWCFVRCLLYHKVRSFCLKIVTQFHHWKIHHFLAKLQYFERMYFLIWVSLYIRLWCKIHLKGPKNSLAELLGGSSYIEFFLE